jgi:predicted MarR family transcription regulator
MKSVKSPEPDLTDAFPSPVVSSAHLARGKSPALSEVEFGLIMVGHSFSRWMVQCMAAAGHPNMSPVEILILHTVMHRSRPKRLAHICLVLDIEDTYLATYAIRKLERAKLVKTWKAGKEKMVSATELGVAACLRYAELREQLLVKSVDRAGIAESSLSDLAGLLRILSGYYDQGARAAATM